MALESLAAFDCGLFRFPLATAAAASWPAAPVYCWTLLRLGVGLLNALSLQLADTEHRRIAREQIRDNTGV